MSAEHAALIAANPFPGLRSFKPAEADRFFGRQQQIEALVARLAATPLLAVSGASGCGKSSLVLAGLLNELARRHADDDETDWRPVVLRPGNRPIANLAAALAGALGGGRASAVQPPGSANPPGASLGAAASQAGTGLGAAASQAKSEADAETEANAAGLDPLARRAASLYGQLRLGGLALVEVVRLARLPAGARVLVVVDQFEEIFRFRRMADADEASAFVKLLLQAAADPASPVSVVLTLRSDTLGGCADFPDLPEAVSAGGYLVPRLTRNQRKEAIARPVELRGARIAPRLVQRLLNDVSADFDDLPVMQHALSRTWQRWAEHSGGARAIDLEDYDAIGGAANALSLHAEEASSSLGALGQAGAMVERVFRALTERVAEGTEVRRPIEFNQLCLVCGAVAGAADDPVSAEVSQVVERFRRTDTAFLLPGADVALAGNPVIDISHESLIRQWQRLRGWVRAEAEASAELQRLVADAQAQATADGELWRGRSLERARDWQQRNRPNAAWVQLCTGGTADEAAARFNTVQAFLDKSAAAQAREQRRSRWQRVGLGALVALVVVVSVGAAFNGLSLQRQARSRELAARAILELAQDPARSARLALLALDQDSDNPRAEYALRQAMATLEVAQAEQIVQLDEPITEARYSPDRKQLIVAGGRTVWLLDAGTLAIQSRLTAPWQVVKAWLVAGQVITLTSDGRAQLQSLDGQMRGDLSCKSKEGVESAAYSPARDGQMAQLAQLAVGCSSGELTLWELDAKGIAARHALLTDASPRPVLTALGFSADGQWLASGDGNGGGRVWKRGLDSRPWIGDAGQGDQPIQHGAAIHDIAFNTTDPSLLATASADASAGVWTLDLAAGRIVPANVGKTADVRLPHQRSVRVARFVDRADDPNRLMTVSDKRVFFWSDPTTHDERRHDDWVTEASVSTDGEYLVSASQDGTARVWSSRTTVPVAVLRGHRNEVTHALFGPAGRIITTSRDRTLRAWRLRPPTLLAAGPTWQLSAALDPGAPRAVLCGELDAEAINCRFVPLAGLGQRPKSAADALAKVSFPSVTEASLSSDGRIVLAHRIVNDLARVYKPVLWDAAARTDITPAWLDFGVAAFNPARAEIARLGLNGAVMLWPLSALTPAAGPAPPPLLTLAAKPGRSALALSPDGRWIALAEGAAVLLWDRQAPGAEPVALRGHSGDVRSLAFNRDGSALVTASTDRSARVWLIRDLRTGLRQNISQEISAKNSKDEASNPAGAGPAAGPGVPSVVPSLVPSLVPSVVLAGGHSAALSSARFSPDGLRVVTASADNSVRVWDAAQGRELATLYRHADAVNSAQFDASGEAILSLSHDGTAMLARCDACRLALPALRRLAEDGVKLAPGELASLSADGKLRLHTFMLPGWLTDGK